VAVPRDEWPQALPPPRAALRSAGHRARRRRGERRGWHLQDTKLNFSACDLLQVTKALSAKPPATRWHDATDTAPPARRNPVSRRPPRSTPPSLTAGSGLSQHTQLCSKFAGSVPSSPAILRKGNIAGTSTLERTIRRGILPSVDKASHKPAIWLSTVTLTGLTTSGYFTESQNHRIVGVGRDLCGSSRQTLKDPSDHRLHTKLLCKYRLPDGQRVRELWSVHGDLAAPCPGCRWQLRLLLRLS